MVLPSKRERFDTVLRLQCNIAMGDEKVIEELHIEVVVLDDQYLLAYRSIGVHLRFHDVEYHVPQPRKRPDSALPSPWLPVGERRNCGEAIPRPPFRAGSAGALYRIALNYP